MSRRGPDMTRAPLRPAADAALLALAGATALATAFPASGGVRPVLALLAAALVPGGAVLTCWRVADPLTWVGLAVAFSLAIETASATCLVWLGLWHPGLLAAAIGLASCVLLGRDLVRVAGPTDRGRAGPRRSPRVGAASR
jgi:hypothetical protein